MRPVHLHAPASSALLDIDVERRASPRRPFDSVATLAIVHRHPLLYRTRDISADGVSILGAIPLVVRTRGIASFVLPTSNREGKRVEVAIVVTHHRLDVENCAYRIGLMFEGVAADTRRLLLRLLTAHVQPAARRSEFGELALPRSVATP